MVFRTRFTKYGHHGNRYQGGIVGRKKAVLEDKNLSREQKKTLSRYANERAANNFREQNTIAELYTLRGLGIFLKETYEMGLDSEDKAVKLQEYVKFHNTPYYRKLLRKFYRWLNGGDIPYCVKWLNAKERKTEKRAKPVLTDEEINAMVKACDAQRDKTLIMLLADTGCRVSEILTLKFGKDSQGRDNISINKEGAEITVKGKTGERRLTLIDSVPYVQNYLNNHPWRDNNGKSFFYAAQDSNRYGEPLQYCGAKMIIKKASQMAGVNKRVTTHIFRRSLATKLGKEERFTIGEVKAQMGWSSIRTADHYLQITSEDTGAKRKAKANGQVIEKLKSEALTPKICPRCETVNAADTSYCKCGMVLDRKAAVKVFEQKQNLDFKFKELEKNLLKALNLRFAQMMDDPRALEAWRKESKRILKKTF